MHVKLRNFVIECRGGEMHQKTKLGNISIYAGAGHTPGDQFTNTTAQTFAALRTVVVIPSWAIAAFHSSRCVDAFAFAVAAAVVFRAPV